MTYFSVGQVWPLYVKPFVQSRVHVGMPKMRFSVVDIMLQRRETTRLAAKLLWPSLAEEMKD